MARPKKNINLSKIALEAGVSQMTVSRVLNNRSGVSEKIRDKVYKIQQKYNYKTIYPSKNNTKIAFAIPCGVVEDYCSRILKGIDNYIKEKDIEITLIMQESASRGLLQKIRDTQASALILPMGFYYKGIYEELKSSGLPVVLLDIFEPAPGFGVINVDSYRGACSATEYLISQGHSKIGYLLPGDERIGDHGERERGYRDTMATNGIDISDAWLQMANEDHLEQGSAYWASVSLAIDRMLKRAPELTAIMAVDDKLALILLQRLQQHGLRVPQDISVVGFDNHSDSGYWFPALTTVDHQLEEAGFQAVKALEYAISNPANWNLPQVTLSAKMIMRDSVAPPRKKKTISF